jgi:hypothetical protein
MKYFKQFSAEEYEKLSNHDKFVQLDNFDVHDSSQSESTYNVGRETKSIQENDRISSNADKVSDDLYWTKGKWREYL